jgi:hypothetical protein
MTAPQRIQRQRTKGWRMPENTVYVGRPSKWGNPFRAYSEPKYQMVVDDRTSTVKDMVLERPTPENWRAMTTKAVELFALHIGPLGLYEIDYSEIRAELAGKNLACWCPLTDAQGNHVPCHADVLLEIANREEHAA